MEPIIWIDSFNIGIPIIDSQHHRIIKMINQLLQDAHGQPSADTISDILNDMTQYAKEHFNTEETLMREAGYPALEPHRKMHSDYRKKTITLCLRATERLPNVPDELLKFIHTWWLKHILQEDMKLKGKINPPQQPGDPTSPSPL